MDKKNIYFSPIGFVPQTYKTIGYIAGIKVLKGMDKQHNNLPEETVSSKAYIRVNADGSFNRYREYNDDHTAKLDIDYHANYDAFKVYDKVYHIHEYIGGERVEPGRLLTKKEFKEYEKFFGGLK